MCLPIEFSSVGISSKYVFGTKSSHILKKQIAKINVEPRVSIIARADVVVSDPTLQWLSNNPGHVILDDNENPLVGSAHYSDEPSLDTIFRTNFLIPDVFTYVDNGEMEISVRKLRRREKITVLDLYKSEKISIERQMFDQVYKGITDIITAKIWPYPAFHTVRLLASFRISPNMVTITGMIFMALAAWYFYTASWALGLSAAWIMTFLDTVDGKLARVTGTSTKLGDILDHGMDWIHPPIWWVCVAVGIGSTTPWIWTSCIIILVTYAAGRASEALFKWHFGFNQYLWKPIDGVLRGIIARQNINLLILTFGALINNIYLGFIAVAEWSIISIGIQVIRSLQAIVSQYRGIPVQNCIA
jgi:phosphatidylglycerophosphate synthase